MNFILLGFCVLQFSIHGIYKNFNLISKFYQFNYLGLLGCINMWDSQPTDSNICAGNLN